MGRTVAMLARRLSDDAVRSGLRGPSVSAGLDEAGRLDLPRLEGVISSLAAAPGASAEIVAHPGEPDDPERERYHWGFRWSSELDALTSSTIRSVVDRNGFVLGTYEDLTVVD